VPLRWPTGDGDREFVTASYDVTGRLWNAATGQPIGEPLRGHEGWVWGATFSPDGTRIVTASYDKTARIWDAATGQQIGEPLRGHGGPVASAAFSPDGKRIVTASWDGTARLWDAATRQPTAELTGHKDNVNSAAFSPDGKRIVTASTDKTARLWEIFADTQVSESARQGRHPTLPHHCAAQGVLSAPRAAAMVHRDGEVALQHPRMETVARRCPRRQEPAAALRAVAGAGLWRPARTITRVSFIGLKSLAPRPGQRTGGHGCLGAAAPGGGRLLSTSMCPSSHTRRPPPSYIFSQIEGRTRQ
jgi:hypothetical protein